METLPFISQHVIQRLKDGSFVPERRSKPGDVRLAERRNTLSPLSVIKRCIRYDPQVFRNRKEVILEIAGCLNEGPKKLMLVTGQSGSGKTTMVRGIVELMGGGPEQLLWFDINLHTDFDEISRFLIQYITYISEALGLETDTPEPPNSPETDPFVRLEYHLSKVAHLPLLLVIDNIEYIVDPEYRIQSYSFKEFLNFLLSFPNIKMVLIGERLPHADISVQLETVQEIKLSPLREADGLQLIQSAGSDSSLDPQVNYEIFHEIFRKSGGAPWLLRTIGPLLQHGIPLETVAAELKQTGASTAEVISRLVYNHLSLEEQGIAQVLALLRHPVDLRSLVAITRTVKPELSGQSFAQIEQTLSQSLLRLIARRNFPPQRVLEQIRKRLDAQQANPEQQPEPQKPPRAWYELYRPVKKALYTIMAEDERLHLHHQLQEFYLLEKNREFTQRIYRVKSKFLLGEATFHGNVAKKRRPAEGDAASLESKSYYYKGIPSAPGEKVLTLEDFRHIQLPEPEATEIAPLLELSLRSAVEGPEPLALSEEEQGLLQEVSPLEAPLRPEPLFTTEAAPVVAEAPLVEKPPLPPSCPEDEAEKQIQHRLAAAVANQNKPEMLHFLLELAHYRATRGLFHSAEECLEKALTLQADASPSILADIYGLLGTIYKETYQYRKALTFLHQATELLEHTDFPHRLERLGKAYQDFGEIEIFRKHYEEAREALLKALDYYRQTHNEYSQAEVYFHLAEIHDTQGQLPEALRYFEQSYRLDEAHENTLSCAATLANMGSIYLELDELPKALEALTQSLAYDAKAKHPEGQFKTLEILASAYGQQKNWPEVEKTYQAALAIAHAEDNNLWRATIYFKLGNFYATRGQWQQAFSFYQSAQEAAPAELSEKSKAMITHKLQETQRHVQPH